MKKLDVKLGALILFLFAVLFAMFLFYSADSPADRANQTPEEMSEPAEPETQQPAADAADTDERIEE